MPLFVPSYVKTGIAQISGGALEWGVPTSGNFTSTATTTLAANQVRYLVMKIEYPIVLNAWQLEVTTGPASNANLAVCIYKADKNFQPTGAPLYDSGSVAVASAFTGLKTTTGLSIGLTPGMYLVGINIDVSMILRAVQGGTFVVDTGMTTNALIQKLLVTQTFGAFPNPGTLWTAASPGGGGMQNSVVWQWTE